MTSQGEDSGTCTRSSPPDSTSSGTQREKHWRAGARRLRFHEGAGPSLPALDEVLSLDDADRAGTCPRRYRVALTPDGAPDFHTRHLG